MKMVVMTEGLFSKTASNAVALSATSVVITIKDRSSTKSCEEPKFSDGEYAISKTVAEGLRNKMSAFKSETGTRKAVHLTMITAFGLARNEYRGLAQSQITFDDMFAT